jgi:hypothetical protein
MFWDHTLSEFYLLFWNQFALSIINKQRIEIKPGHDEYRCYPSCDILSARIDKTSEPPNLRKVQINEDNWVGINFP